MQEYIYTLEHSNWLSTDICIITLNNSNITLTLFVDGHDEVAALCTAPVESSSIICFTNADWAT